MSIVSIWDLIIYCDHDCTAQYNCCLCATTDCVILIEQILNSLCHILIFELVKEISVQQPLAYGMLYLQTSSELPLY